MFTEQLRHSLAEDPNGHFVDYGIAGDFRGEEFMVLFYRAQRQAQAWLFNETTFYMVFNMNADDVQSDKNPQSIAPFIAWDAANNAFEKQDLIRMAMMSRYISKILLKEYY